MDALPNSIKAFGSDGTVDGTAGFIADGLFETADALEISSAAAAPGRFLVYRMLVHLFLLRLPLMHYWGENPVVTAKLQLNGQDRFSECEGTHFDQVQPWQHHTRAPDTGVNVYSFALRPEDINHRVHATCPALTTPSTRPFECGSKWFHHRKGPCIRPQLQCPVS